MQKKLLCGLAPLLAVVAFMVVPAMASAAPQWYVCQKVTAKTGKFTKINCATEKAESNFEKELVGNLSNAVLVDSRNVTGTVAKLEIPELGSGIECTKIEDESYLWNRAGRGRDINEVLFTGCKATGAIATLCTVAEPIVVEASTRLEEPEAGKIYNKYFSVSEEPFTEVTLANKGTETCPAAGTLPVTGTVKGEIAVGGGKIQKFKGGTLKFGPYAATFEAETEQEGTGGEGIFVK